MPYNLIIVKSALPKKINIFSRRMPNPNGFINCFSSLKKYDYLYLEIYLGICMSSETSTSQSMFKTVEAILSIQEQFRIFCFISCRQLKNNFKRFTFSIWSYMYPNLEQFISLFLCIPHWLNIPFGCFLFY